MVFSNEVEDGIEVAFVDDLNIRAIRCRFDRRTANEFDRTADLVRFHTLNARTGNRVVSRYVDAVTARPVPDEDQARGYPRGEDEFVLLEDDELDSIALDFTLRPRGTVVRSELHLTPKALPKLAEIGVLGERTRAEALADIPQAEREQLLQTLTQLKSNLASACAAPVARERVSNG